MGARCCPECFGDRGLRKDIIPSLGPDIGDCDFCGSSGVELVEPQSLSTYFELLVDTYEPDSSGKPLVEWMREDWELFAHPRLDTAHAKELLAEILNDGEIVRRPFIPGKSFESQGVVQWETLRDEMMHRNRWFLDVPFDAERLETLLAHMLADDLPQVWYRARLQDDRGGFGVHDMGAPPKRLASHGRANPAGIPYLYLGSNAETATAELRPHTGEVACVADFTVERPIRAVDLRAPRKLVSPFLLADSDAIGQLRADLPFLERLGDELTRPVLRSGAAIDYIPSQYLCEFVKKCGYDGVVYRSSVSDGINLALFDPDRAVGRSVETYSVERVAVTVEPTGS